MKIGVVSDTHNNLKSIETIIHLFNDRELEYVIHTGDIANSHSLERFSKLNSKLIGVYGNNDRCEVGIKEVAIKYKFSFQNPPSKFKLQNREIAIFHEPEHIDQFLSENRRVDIVIHGHTHRYRNEMKNGILYFNPGESAGMLKGKNAIGIVDLVNLKAKRIFF